MVLGLVGIGVAALSWQQLPSVGTSAGSARTATATVVEQATCGRKTSGDLVEVRLDGQARRLRLDGCGHVVGERFRVQVAKSGGRATQLDETGGDGLSGRVTWVLLTLAGVAGGGYVLLLFRHRLPGRSRPA